MTRSIHVWPDVPIGSAVRTMMYVITLVHPPELCLAREEFGDESMRWIAGMDDMAERLNIQIHGAYACPSEHAFSFILDTDGFKNIAIFLPGIMRTHHTGQVSLVVSLREASDLLIK